MALMELTLEQQYRNQKIINRWNYVGTGTPTAVTMSFALIYALGFTSPPVPPETGVDFWSRLRQLQNVGVTNTLVTVRNVYSFTDFFSNPLGAAPGLATGQPSAPFLAFGFRTNQVTKKVRPGQKRIVGVSDDDTGDGGIFDAGALGRMDNLAIEMTEVQTYDDSGQILTFKPCIVARERYTTPSGGTAYKYYDDEATQMQNVAESVIWSAKTGVRSQTTRQYGRGV